MKYQVHAFDGRRTGTYDGRGAKDRNLYVVVEHEDADRAFDLAQRKAQGLIESDSIWTTVSVRQLEEC